MRIPDSQVEVKKIAGQTGSGSPVVYILTKGGLHAFFSKGQDGAAQSLGASPHVAISRWLSEQKDPTIRWNQEFIQKAEEVAEDLQKNESSRYVALRKAMFAPVVQLSEPSADAYLVYDALAKTFTVMDLEEIRKGLQDGDVDRYDLVRHVSLSEPPYLAEDHPKLQGGES